MRLDKWWGVWIIRCMNIKKFFLVLGLGVFFLGFGGGVQAGFLPEVREWSSMVDVGVGEYVHYEAREFNAFFVEVVRGDCVDYRVRVDGEGVGVTEGGGGTRWEYLHTEDADEPTELFLVNPTREVVIYADAPGRLELHFMDTDAGEGLSVVSGVVASTDFSDFEEAGIEIITREEWGADESLRYYEKGDDLPEAELVEFDDDYYEDYADELVIERVVDREDGNDLIWPWQYPEKIRKVVLHHTAGMQNLNDPAAAIRSIYYYHTVSRGWGDIGYNFIIDTEGRIYEGRSGGEMVVGAHAGRANVGSVGIAVIGDYHTELEVPGVVEDSLVELMSFLADKYELNPVAVESFRGMSLPNIIGHRDVGNTACPGDRLYAKLPEIRERVAGMVGTWADESEYNFEVRGSLPYLDVDPMDEKVVAIQLTNTGTKTWGVGTTIIPIDTSNAIYATVEKSELLEPEVGPGEVGTFFTTVRAGRHAGIQTVNLALQVNGDEVTEATFPIPVRVAQPVFDFEFVSSKYPKSELTTYEETSAEIVVKNTSNFTWFQEGEGEVHLAVLPKGGKSRLVTNPYEEGEEEALAADNEIFFDPSVLAYLEEDEVVPGEVAHFKISFTGGEEFGVFEEKFTLFAPKMGWFPDKGMMFVIMVSPPESEAELVGGYPQVVYDLMGGERVELNVKLKNMGDLVWREGKVDFVSMDSSFPVVYTRFEGPVGPGEVAEFEIVVQAPYESGRHVTTLKMRTGISGAEYFDEAPEFTLSASVPYSVLRAEVVGSSVRSIQMLPWEEKVVEIKLKNTGTVSWHSKGGPEGQGAMMLGTSSPRNRQSDFWNPAWVKTTRGAKLKEVTVEPGGVGTFELVLRAGGELGNHQEVFEPVVDWVEWVSGSPVTLWVQVVDEKTEDGNVQVTRRVVSEQTVNPEIKEPEVLEEGEEVELREGDEPRIRVRLLFDAEDFEISSSGGMVVKTLEGVEVAEYRAGDVALVEEGRFEGKKYEDGLRFEAVGEDGVLTIENWEHVPGWNASLNDNRYRDTLEIRKYDGDWVKNFYSDWVVINELEMGEYMRGLAEVPESEPLEKHKAVMVAAQTYALWYLTEEDKFPGAPYDASDDPDVFQKYLGYGYEVRAPKHVLAVKTVNGVVVEYGGEIVKTPYFNSSDGRTRSAEEVWGWTNTPYLQSVEDPYCSGMGLSGHGVGLSGSGATGAAEVGRNYEEILKYYYTAVDLVDLY